MMINKKAIAVASVTLVLLAALTACSSNTTALTAGSQDKTSNATVKNGVMKEDGLNQRYVKILAEIRKSAPAGSEKRLAVYEKNLPIMQDMNKRAYAYSGSGFYVESTTTATGNRQDQFVVKEYWQDGNYRYEQFNKTGKLAYLEVYNKAEDVNYSYEMGKDLVRKTTKCSQKGIAPTEYEYGFFTVHNNALSGEFKTVDYKGKKAISSVSKTEGVSKNGDTQYKSEWRYLYDAETGILLKEEQRASTNGQMQVDVTEKKVMPNQKFNPSVFKYDPKQKSVKTLK